jgi:adenylate cyclase
MIKESFISPSLKALFDFFFKRVPIVHKVGIVLISLVILTTVTFSLIVQHRLTQALLEQLELVGGALAEQTANSAAELILAEDLLSLNVIVTKVAKSPYIIGAGILNAEQTPLAQAGSIDATRMTTLKAEHHPSDFAVFTAPIRFKDVNIGVAIIVLDKRIVTTTLKNSIHWISAGTFALILVGIGVALLLARHITNPLNQLIDAAKNIRKGQFDHRLPEKRSDEIGDLMHSFNEMMQGLKEHQQMAVAFNRYLDPSVVNALLYTEPTKPPFDYTEASVLFVDIVGFTALSEKLKPQEIVLLLNTYYTLVQKVANQYGGIVDKYMGDGAMIIFGAPIPDPHHAFKATCSGMTLVELAGELNQCLPHIKRLNQIQIRLGLHTGMVLAGTLGGHERMQYTVIGDNVNIASRICDQGIPGKLTMSQKSYEAMEGAQRLDIDHSYTSEIRGRRERISVVVVNRFNEQYALYLSPFIEELRSQFFNPYLLCEAV